MAAGSPGSAPLSLLLLRLMKCRRRRLPTDTGMLPAAAKTAAEVQFVLHLLPLDIAVKLSMDPYPPLQC
jgi:hypothetical protein